MGYWKRKQERDEVREADIELARRELAKAQSDQQDVVSRAPIVASLSAYLAERRELNHFGEALSDSITPRRRHA